MHRSDAPLCAAPDNQPRRPNLVVPAGACDCHVHVFGPGERYPYQHERAYTPPDCLPEALFKMHGILGIERAVIVQASVHGINNQAILDAVALAPHRLRAVASVTQSVDDNELVRLHDGGVRGIRVNMVDKGGMPFDSLDDLAAMSHRIKDLGWHIELLVHVEEIDNLREIVASLSVPVVVGHFGYTKTRLTVSHPGFQDFLHMLGDGRCWVKLTGPYRISSEDRVPYADTSPFAAALLVAAPQRLLWGSDWPHVMQVKPMPNDGDLLDLLAMWVPDEASRRGILVDNPAALYGFNDHPTALRDLEEQL